MAAAQPRSGPRLVGRGPALAAVADFLARARDEPVALVVEGDAGMGKTTVWRAALSRAAEGFVLLTCAPSAAETGLAFAGLTDLLRGVDEQVLARLPGPQRLALDVATCRASPGERGLHPLAVALGVLAVLDRLAADAPVVVAVDDLHWLDRDSAAALHFALRRAAGPVSLLASRREGVMPPGGLPVLGDVPHQVVRLGPLVLDELDELLTARLGRQLRLPSLVQVLRVSRGNPLHALEVARAALQAGVELEPGRPLPVPPNLRSLLRARLDEVVDAVTTLTWVAALAHPTTPALAAALGPAALGHLGAASAAGLVTVTGDRIAFSHPLLAAVLLDDLDAEASRQLHAEVAAVVEDPVERARHLALATADVDPGVAALLDEASSLAARRAAAGEAAWLAEQALRLTADHDLDRRCARVVAAGSLHEAAGSADRGRALLEEQLTRMRPGPGRVGLLLALASIRSSLGGARESAEVYQQALEESLGSSQAAAAVHQSLAWELAATGRVRQAVAHADACVRLAGQLAEPSPGVPTDAALALGAGCLAAAGLVELFAGRPSGRVHLQRALTQRPRPGPTSALMPVLVDPLWASTVAAAWSDDAHAARRSTARLRASAVERGDLETAEQCDWLLVLVELRAGEWGTALASAQAEVAATLRQGQANDEPLSLWLLALVQAHLGKVEGARAVAEQGRRLAAETDQPYPEAQCTAVLGFLSLSSGQAQDAWQQLAPLPDRLADMGYGEPNLQRCTADAIEAATAVGALGEASRLLDRFADQARVSTGAWGLAAAARCRALLLSAGGEIELAARVADEAVEAHEELGQPFELGRALLVAGELARRRKRKAEARRSLERASLLFTSLPAPLWAARAQTAVDRLGGRPASPLALTGTERQVAELVARGLSNGEVAAALFVSVKTVEWNLSKVYRKTSLGSRAELAARWPLEA